MLHPLEHDIVAVDQHGCRVVLGCLLRKAGPSAGLRGCLPFEGMRSLDIQGEKDILVMILDQQDGR